MPAEVYLDFNGNARQALKFYSEAFQTPLNSIMTYGEMPQDGTFTPPPETKDLVLYSHLMIGGSTIHFSDVTPDRPVAIGNNITIMVSDKNAELIESAFKHLSHEGKVIMELGETFFSKRYGYVIDKFGVGWQLSVATDADSEYMI